MSRFAIVAIVAVAVVVVAACGSQEAANRVVASSSEALALEVCDIEALRERVALDREMIFVCPNARAFLRNIDNGDFACVERDVDCEGEGAVELDTSALLEGVDCSVDALRAEFVTRHEFLVICPDHSLLAGPAADFMCVANSLCLKEGR